MRVEKEGMSMEAKAFLKQYQEALIDIRNLKAEAEELESMAMSITVGTDGERVQTSGKQDRMAELAAKIADIEIDIVNRRTDALKILQDVGRVIAAVDDKDCRQLLHRRYIENNTWEQIAVSMNYTYRWITKLHGRSLLKVAELLQNKKSS